MDVEENDKQQIECQRADKHILGHISVRHGVPHKTIYIALIHLVWHHKIRQGYKYHPQSNLQECQ
jgi:hypothetical protein